MGKLRIAMLVLVIGGLGYEFYVAGQLATARAQVADQLRKAIDGSEKSLAAHERARQEQISARQTVNLLPLSWGQERTLTGAAVNNVRIVQPGTIEVNGIETAWLNPVQVTDAAGQNQTVHPPVHVFGANQQGVISYLGEFVIDPGRFTQQSFVLFPRWNVFPGESQQWDISGGVRFRTQIPLGGRSIVENFRNTIQKSREKIAETDARIVAQQQLNAAAAADLEKRRRELLGDPDAAVNEDHPEYTLGLVQALEDLEEERNAVQIDVDRLRRVIKAALNARESLVDALKQVADSTRVKASRVTQRPE